MPFAEDFVKELESQGKNSYKLIERFVDISKAEDLHVDFKRKANPKSSVLEAEDKRNLAKALSGFAHSEGGLIIWGIKAERKDKNDPESPDVASGKDPIKNLSAFVANLNNELKIATRPPVDGARNFACPKSNGSGYAVTVIPISENPPHRAEGCNNHFYKRSGSNFYHLEPFDLRDLISRQNYPKVGIEVGWNPVGHYTATHRFYELRVAISNAGPTILEKWRFQFEISDAIYYQDQIGSRHPFLDYFQFTGENSGTWKRVTFTSFPGTQTLLTLMPEENVKLFGKDDGKFHLTYAVTQEVLALGGSRIYWKFFSENTPAQRGSLTVNRGSFCDY